MANDFIPYKLLPQRLYSGFAGSVLPKVRAEGLRPREQTQVASKWDDHPSAEGLVYLTDMWGIFYGIQANRSPTLTKETSFAIAEINT